MPLCGHYVMRFKGQGAGEVSCKQKRSFFQKLRFLAAHT